jgi:hypothetical protein
MVGCSGGLAMFPLEELGDSVLSSSSMHYGSDPETRRGDLIPDASFAYLLK